MLHSDRFIVPPDWEAVQNFAPVAVAAPARRPTSVAWRQTLAADLAELAAIQPQALEEIVATMRRRLGLHPLPRGGHA